MICPHSSIDRQRMSAPVPDGSCGATEEEEPSREVAIGGSYAAEPERKKRLGILRLLHECSFDSGRPSLTCFDQYMDELEDELRLQPTCNVTVLYDRPLRIAYDYSTYAVSACSPIAPLLAYHRF